MSKKGVEEKHSQTALFASLYRAIANKECKSDALGPDYLAVNFLPASLKFLIRFKSIRARVKKKDQKLTPGTFEFMAARTAFFDQVFLDALNQKVPQIVLLGAGYDTRAYRFARINKTSKIFELDIAPTQTRKKECLKKGQIDIPLNVALVPIDFNIESIIVELGKAGYVQDKRALFIWEGVSYYLEPESVDATLGFVKNASHPESVIAFDYAISTSEENREQYYGAKEFIQTWQKHRQGESFKFSIDAGKAETFLEQRGLRLINHLDTRQIEETFLLDENGSLLGRTNGLFRFAVAAPDNNTHFSSG